MHDYIAETAYLVLLGLQCIAFCGVELRAFNICDQSLNVGVDDVRGRELLAVIVDGMLVLLL